MVTARAPRYLNVTLVALSSLHYACWVPDPLYCAQDSDCFDLGAGWSCDLIPTERSNYVRNTCVPPQPDAGVESADAADSTDALVDGGLADGGLSDGAPLDAGPTCRTKLAITKSGFGIIIAEEDGGGVVEVAATGARNPRWSPNGRYLAYNVEQNDQTRVFVATEGSAVQISADGVSCSAPAWSPNSERLVFSCGSADSWDLVVVDRTGLNRRTLNTTTVSVDTYGTWSRDGERILFSRKIVDGNGDIYSIKPDGTSLVRLTTGSADDVAPSSAPVGDLIAFVRDKDLHTMTSAGGSIRNISGSTWPDNGAVWSPDGSKLLVSSNLGNPSASVAMVDADGTDWQETSERTVNIRDESPTWSPDGKRFAFASSRSGQKIHIMDADLTDLTSVIEGRAVAWQPRCE